MRGKASGSSRALVLAGEPSLLTKDAEDMLLAVPTER